MLGEGIGDCDGDVADEGEDDGTSSVGVDDGVTASGAGVCLVTVSVGLGVGYGWGIIAPPFGAKSKQVAGHAPPTHRVCTDHR